MCARVSVRGMCMCEMCVKCLCDVRGVFLCGICVVCTCVMHGV